MLIIYTMAINQLEEIKTISIHPFSFSLDRNFSDYLYLREDWIALKGKRLQSKRNHLKRFLQNYEYEYKPYTDAYLNDASLCMETFGYPSVSAKTLIRWQAEWILDGGRALGKPTHFEERKGSY